MNIKLNIIGVMKIKKNKKYVVTGGSGFLGKE